MSGSTRVVLLSNTYAPNRAPVWRALAEKVGRLDVILLRDQEANRIWDIDTDKAYTIHTLRTYGLYLPFIDSGLYWGGGIGKKLTSLDPTHLIVSGFSAPPFLEAIVWARKHNIPLVQWYYSHALSSRFRGGLIHWMRGLILRRADAWATAGTMARDYLINMGIPSERVVLVSNPVDVCAFNYGVDDIRVRNGPARILYIGQFIERKGIVLLVEAFRQMKCEAKLRLVGYGSQEVELREVSADMDNVEILPPTRNPKEAAKHYRWADIVVMPSTREVWGLVVNEALAAGCYVLSSNVAGVTPDLVENAPLDVGRSIDPSLGPVPLAHVMDEVVENINAYRSRRGVISSWGMEFTPERTAKGLIKTLEQVRSL